MGTAAKTRRSDRQQARQTKKADIQNGDSRSEARDAKHTIKSTDRAQWKAEGKSIGLWVMWWETLQKMQQRTSLIIQKTWFNYLFLPACEYY